MPELVGVFAVDRLPHLPHPVTGIVRLIDILDHHHQRPVPAGPGRGLTLLVCVIRAHSNPCSSPGQGSHDWLDSELVAVVVDEGDDSPASGRYPLFDGRSSSAAKKAALFRISLALFASANSARNRRFYASRSTDSAGVALPQSLCLRTQTRRVSLLNPSSFATRVIAPFAVSGSAWAWITSSTARALSSSVYFTGKRESPSSTLPASIIPGAIQVPGSPARPHVVSVPVRRCHLSPGPPRRSCRITGRCGRHRRLGSGQAGDPGHERR